MKVVLDTLTLFIADKVSNLDGAAQLLASLLDILSNIDLAVLNEGLLEQADFLIELVDTAVYHLLLNLSGLASQLRIVLDLSQDDLFFLGYHISGNAHGADIAG